MSGMKKSERVNLRIFGALALFIFYTHTFSQYSQNSFTDLYQVKNNVYIHNQFGSNITILEAKEGLLIIDTGYPNLALHSDSIIKARFKKGIVYIISTHHHYDHTGGNDIFSREGAKIIAFEGTRSSMLKEWIPPVVPGVKHVVLPPFKEDFLPEICFYDSMIIYFGNEKLKLIHIPGGHSNNDIITKFENSNVMHTGDLFLSNYFPPFSGEIESYIKAVDSVITFCNENTVVIPGHGPISDKDGLISYKKRLLEGHDRILKLKSEGKSFEEVIKSKPLKDLLQTDNDRDYRLFIYCVYYGVEEI